MLFDIINDLAFVNIECVSKLLKQHILSSAKVVYIRGVQFLSAFCNLFTAKIQRFYQSDDLLFISVPDDPAVFFLAFQIILKPYRLFGIHVRDQAINLCF